ncbi:DUF2799 domain-containing protein [Cognatiyoonia sp. IB215182]|uniref:DUF2799 domain-containing protein n=1 Tax=Cognatiyoonia sp. IB215182 TaxID=3097353 RepID=UPI002A0AE781|nr:DUF2799 domain-containing protein [Cognatiyoonia sp. IB215182]MDX8354769.1 DUF2799 domain-containing protein [Cognatiyoonia sp. IB215182]
MHLRLILIPVFFTLLSACAELTDFHCGNINWYDFGYNAGLEGKSSLVITREAALCDGSATLPRADRALEGYNAGLRNYCTPRNAFSVGQRGEELSPACPSAELSLMRQPHLIGLRDHRLLQQIKDLEQDRDALETQRDSTEIDEDTRRQIRRDIRDIDGRIDRLEDRRLLLLMLVS